MPELPEVQTIVNDLIDAGLVSARITAVKVDWPRSIAGMSPQEFARRLKGSRIENIRRRAKYIIFDLGENNGALLVHLRMSGRLLLADASGNRDKHEHVSIAFSDSRELRLHDTRKFARLYLCTTAEEITEGLGPEPLEADFTLSWFRAMLKKRSRMLKPLLLDQRFIAGLGNIYVDEALWEAGLHPCRRACTLTSRGMQAAFHCYPARAQTRARQHGHHPGNRGGQLLLGRRPQGRQPLAAACIQKNRPCMPPLPRTHCAHYRGPAQHSYLPGLPAVTAANLTSFRSYYSIKRNWSKRNGMSFIPGLKRMFLRMPYTILI